MKTIRVLMSAMVLVMTGCGMNDQTALTSSDIAKKAMDAKQYTGDEANKTRQYFSSRDVSSAGVGDKYYDTTTYVGEEANKTRGYAYDRGICNVEHGSQCSSPTAGANGSDGVTGTNGSNGTNGSDGVTGTNGSNGTNGSDGVAGTNGSDGVAGTNGTDGTNGTNGTNATTALYTLSSSCQSVSGIGSAKLDGSNVKVYTAAGCHGSPKILGKGDVMWIGSKLLANDSPVLTVVTFP